MHNIGIYYIALAIIACLVAYWVFRKRDLRLQRKLFEYTGADFARCHLREIPGSTDQYRGICEECALLEHRGRTLADRLDAAYPEPAKSVRACTDYLRQFLERRMDGRSGSPIYDRMKEVARSAPSVQDGKLAHLLDAWVDDVKIWVAVIVALLPDIARAMENEKRARFAK